MDQMTALTVLALVYGAANLIAQKTRARISMMFICSCILLGLFWSGMPRTIFDDTKMIPISMAFIALLMVQMGSMMDAAELKSEWRTVAVSFLGMCAGAAGILCIATHFIGWDFALAATGPVSGGVVAGLIMIEAADVKGVTSIAVFVTMLLTVQGLFGVPVASNCLLHEGKKLKARFAAGERAPGATAAAAGSVKKRLIPPMPKRWHTPYVLIAKAFVVAWLANEFAALYNGAVPGWAQIHVFVMTLIFGIIARELGFIEKNILEAGNANGMGLFVIMIPIFVNLAKATPQMVLDLLWPLVIVFASALAGIFVASVVLSKIFGYSWCLSVALSSTCLFGFPGTLIISQEVAAQLGDTEEEREFMLSYILPKMLIAGFVTVTISSVFLAGFLVKFF